MKFVENECRCCGDSLENNYLEIDGVYYCNEGCAEDDGYVLVNCCNEYKESNVSIEVDGNYFCNDSCANDSNYYECSRCGTFCELSDGIDLLDDESEFYCSSYCIEKTGNYGLCSYCDEYKSKYYFLENIDGDSYCSEKCITDADYVSCLNCGEYIKEDDTVLINGDCYCVEDCVNYSKCSGCGDYVLEKDEHVTSDNKTYCSVYCVRGADYVCCTGCDIYFPSSETFNYQNQTYCSKSCGNVSECKVCKSNYDFQSLKSEFCSKKCEMFYLSNSTDSNLILYRSKYSFDNLNSKLLIHDKKYLSNLKLRDIERYRNLGSRYNMLVKSKILEDKGFMVSNSDNQFIQYAYVKNDKAFIVSLSSLLIVSKSKNEIHEIYDLSKEDNLNKLNDLIKKGFVELTPFLYLHDMRRNLSNYIRNSLELNE